MPILYGFKSYASFPIILSDGSFYGTLCAIDPSPRRIATADVIETMRRYAEQVARLLDQRAGR